MSKKILITPKSFSKYINEVKSIFEERDFEIVKNDTGRTFTEDEMVTLCEDIDGIIIGIDPMTERVLRSAKRLKAISKYGTGVDNIDLAAAKELGVKIKKTLGANSTSVAELSVAMLFVMARNIVINANNVKAGGWSRAAGCEITGKTVGVIGLGYIGKEVVRMCHGLGMRIIACDPYLKDSEFIERYSCEMMSFEDTLRNSDFVSLNMPLTNDNRNIINKKSLQLMKRTAYLINTSRGELVNEGDLYEALKEGIIAGASEDVFSQEPPKGHKLLELDNFILTPHIGAYTKEATYKMVLQSVYNLVKLLE